MRQLLFGQNDWLSGLHIGSTCIFLTDVSLRSALKPLMCVATVTLSCMPNSKNGILAVAFGQATTYQAYGNVRASCRLVRRRSLVAPQAVFQECPTHGQAQRRSTVPNVLFHVSCRPRGRQRNGCASLFCNSPPCSLSSLQILGEYLAKSRSI